MDEFEQFDEIDVPDQWDDIVARSRTHDHRAEVSAPTHHRRIVLLSAAAVMVVALVAGIVVVSRSDDDLVSTDTVTSTEVVTSTDTVTSTDGSVTEPPVTDPGPPAPVPETLSCGSPEDLDRIGDLLRSGQPTYDYQAAADLAELVEWSTVVVTGSIVSVQRGPGEFTNFELADVEVVAGNGEVERFATSALWAGGQGPDPLAAPVAIEGLRIVAFLDALPDAPGGWAAFVDGVAFGCDDLAHDSLAGTPPDADGLTVAEIADAARAADSEIVARLGFDPEVCEMVSARGSGEPQEISDYSFFARPSPFPVSIQILGEPGTTLADPFAFVQRYQVDPGGSRGSTDDPLEINGATVGLQVYDNGNGEADIRYDDGTLGYVRTRGYDRDDLIELIGQLSPRPFTDTVTGFDVAGGRFVSLHEGIDTETLSLVGRSAWCRVADTGFVYRLSVYGGDPIYTFGGVIDRPVPESVGMRGDSVLIISGLDDPAAPGLDDVVVIAEDEWNELLVEPVPGWEDERIEPIAPGTPVVVALADAEDPGAPPTNFITLRLVIEGGASFLEFDFTGTSVHPDAASRIVMIDGRERGRTSAPIEGDTYGIRIADDETPGPFDVAVQIRDESKFLLQLTETLRLVPG